MPPACTKGVFMMGVGQQKVSHANFDQCLVNLKILILKFWACRLPTVTIEIKEKLKIYLSNLTIGRS